MSDTSPFGFGRFVPGFDFLQNLAKGATGGAPQMPSLSSWVAPTLSVEELEKRIDELKAVQFWLEQNSRALTATVQALEVQKMTLATLKGMNVAMGDLAGAFAPKAAPAPAHTPAAAPEPARASPAPHHAPPIDDAAAHDGAGRSDGDDAAASPASSALPGVVDPMQWWGALTSQFQQIAANALGDPSQQAAVEATRGAATEAFKTATDMATQMAAQGLQGVQEAARMATAGVPSPSASKPARSPKRPAAPAAARSTRAAAAPAKAPVKKAAAPRPAPARRNASAPPAAKTAAPRKRAGQ
ncbi:PhaM family polyhydroxyalkanoate granule multifunctional regulatory protein [Acidovorax sp. SUPP3334]|uniref:PhaM family polyhydroxyalkanoate granule multifunctional regulatory protein n=1 Tax=Acidovorax sp. SUPP3334 TaxID=2920881 RepID=UPI0023DE6A82|nr:PhaM family polyhydroxyalkanoate granule multifunctional regulatory protein [Acidovorax sp. SUPP3334]GKT26497.1 hypothetical protein AVHM3334_21180 [Acidovorax sp. SUPP3334]